MFGKLESIHVLKYTAYKIMNRIISWNLMQNHLYLRVIWQR